MLELLANPWYIVTLFGAPEAWMALTAVLFGSYIAFRTGSMGGSRAKELLFLLVPSLVLTFLVVIALKGFIGVPRECVPCITELVTCNPYCPLDASMPSGHAATAFAGFTSLWIVTGRKRRWLPVFIIPAVISLSRIMLGVHSALDVLLGSAIGLAIAASVWKIHERL